MPLPDEILRLSAAAAVLKEQLSGNLFSHVIVAAERSPGGMVRLGQVLLPCIEKATEDLREITVLFAAIADNRDKCQSLIDAFEAKRVPADKRPMPVPTEPEPTPVVSHWKLVCRAKDGHEREIPFLEGDLLATLAHAAKNATAMKVAWTDAVVLTAATQVDNVWQWRVHLALTAKAQAMLCEEGGQ